MGISTKYIFRQLFKIMIVIILAIGLFVAGTMIGYGVIGDGSPKEVFNSETWSHILQFIK